MAPRHPTRHGGLLVLVGAGALVVLMRTTHSFASMPMSPIHGSSHRQTARSSKTMLSATAVAERVTTADQVIAQLIQGNRRFLGDANEKFKPGLSPRDLLVESPYAQISKKALVLSCAYLDLPLDAVFDVQA
eukprot:3062489-Amphidinium_carterae.1